MLAHAMVAHICDPAVTAGAKWVAETDQFVVIAAQRALHGNVALTALSDAVLTKRFVVHARGLARVRPRVALIMGIRLCDVNNNRPEAAVVRAQHACRCRFWAYTKS